MPQATKERRVPSEAMTPQPVRRRPGSMPRMRTAPNLRPRPWPSAASETSKFTNTFWTSSCSSRNSTSRISFSAASSSTATLVCAPPDHGGLARLAEAGLQRLGHLVQRALLAGDLVAVLRRGDVVCARLDRGVQHRVRVGDLRVERDQAHAVEHEGHRAGLGEVAAVLGEGRADVGGGAVTVVRHRLDDDRRAAGAVALVADLLVGLGVAALRLLDRPLDVVLRHVLGPRGEDGGAQTRVHGGVRQAEPRRHGDLARELGEDAGAHGVHAPLPVHDVLELGMAGHGGLRVRRPGGLEPARPARREAESRSYRRRRSSPPRAETLALGARSGERSAGERGRAPHPGVAAAAAEQLGVRSAFDDLAPLHDVNVVAADDRLEAVRDEDDRAAALQARQASATSRRSCSGSSALVGSSSTRKGASVSSARAMARRWRWPPDRFWPPSARSVS